MTSYTFRGQVKVSDVQAAFDDFVNRINTIITTYNNTNQLIDSMDLSKGAPTLAAGGYSLSVGGLKKILEMYDGVLLGCRAFRIDETHVAITDGMYITENAAVRINPQILEGDGYDIYLNTETGELALVDDNTYPQGFTHILQLSNTGGVEYLNEFRDVQLAEVPGYKLTIQKRDWGAFIEQDNPNIHRFQGAGADYVPKEGAGSVDFYDGTTRINVIQGYADWDNGTYRKHLWVDPAKFLFIPKGCNTPLQVTDDRRIRRTQYTINLEKNK